MSWDYNKNISDYEANGKKQYEAYEMALYDNLREIRLGYINCNAISDDFDSYWFRYNLDELRGRDRTWELLVNELDKLPNIKPRSITKNGFNDCYKYRCAVFDGVVAMWESQRPYNNKTTL